MNFPYEKLTVKITRKMADFIIVSNQTVFLQQKKISNKLLTILSIKIKLSALSIIFVITVLTQRTTIEKDV